jgi:membrane-associated PAP2 superfamily phosphatase
MAETTPPGQDPSQVRTDVPQPPPEPGERKASGFARAGAVILALIFAFAAAVMIAVMIDIGDSPRCDDQQAVQEALREAEPGEEVDCFEGSSTAKAASLALGWPSGVLGAIVVLLALAFAIRGRGGRPLAIAAIAALVLGGLSILVGSI